MNTPFVRARRLGRVLVIGDSIQGTNFKGICNWKTPKFCSSRHVIWCVDNESLNAAPNLVRGESLREQGEGNNEICFPVPICQVECDVACNLHRILVS